MSDSNQHNQQRRDALKKLITGSSAIGAAAVMPDKWAKPVVDAVLLPAHAQTSPRVPTSFAGPVAGPGPSPAGRLLDQLIPPAQAGNGFPSDTLCVDTSTGEALLIRDSGDLTEILEGTGAAVGGGAVTLTDICIDGGSSVNLRLTSVSATGLNFVLDMVPGTLPPGAWTNPGCNANGVIQIG
ncbi:MAG: hypothetical protein OEU36_12615 [Gammaproteobacteria bacterium]|nr:hypothetical protein [Gammaproteobacteria bacterium]